MNSVYSPPVVDTGKRRRVKSFKRKFQVLNQGTDLKALRCGQHRGKQEEEGDFIEILDSRLQGALLLNAHIMDSRL